MVFRHVPPFRLRPLLGLLLLASAAFSATNGDFYHDVSRLNRVLLEIDRRYVEEIGSRDMTDAAIDGLRGVLDPHTAVFAPKDYSDLKVSTDGEFGGLGITIAIRDRVLTIISPLEGTPASRAGLQAGDRILSIDGKSTKGITADGAVEKLRGKVGTEVELEIAREGMPETMKVRLTRDRIQIHSVPYFGMLDKETGYVKVITFAKKTAEDLAAAIEELKGKGMKKLVLDLRHNPGGLLEQAVEVIGEKSDSSHFPPNGISGRGAKKCFGRIPVNILCMPPGSLTDIAPSVSPWYPPFSAAMRQRCGCPTAAWYWIAIFNAHSTAMEPESA